MESPRFLSFNQSLPQAFQDVPEADLEALAVPESTDTETGAANAEDTSTPPAQLQLRSDWKVWEQVVQSQRAGPGDYSENTKVIAEFNNIEASPVCGCNQTERRSRRRH
eukprot:GHVU01191828.1.p3 GENE.GHVU01191828.1~~GHVU01191828.1.p3  ORF type:complete len:109 (+),score=15.79 GHVU01191828.1:406-732(+)